MKRWPKKPLCEVLEVSRERIEPTEYPNTPFNYVGLESIEGHTGKLLSYRPKPGAEIKSTKNVFHHNQILYGKLRPYLNKVHLAYQDGICSTDIYVLQPRQQQIHPSFAAHFLRSSLVLAVVSNAMAGANLPRINEDNLLGIRVSVPPLAEQRRIVGILDEAFEGIATAKANAEKNLQNARAVFESHLNAVFTQRGEGWVEKRLAEICVLQRGFDLPTRSRVPGDFPLVSSSGVIDSHNEGPVSGPGVATGRSGSIGNVFYIEDDYWPLNTVLYVKEFHGNYPKFVYRLLSHFDLRRFATGAGVPTLNRNFVHDERVVVPESKTVQKKIAEQFDGIEQETRCLESIYRQKLSALEELKKSLLHQAFVGGL